MQCKESIRCLLTSNELVYIPLAVERCHDLWGRLFGHPISISRRCCISDVFASRGDAHSARFEAGSSERATITPAYLRHVSRLLIFRFSSSAQPACCMQRCREFTIQPFIIAKGDWRLASVASY
eukprot:scaffold3797_cov91-Skeletonema_dohrnii-CCMP3373.AAC.2